MSDIRIALRTERRSGILAGAIASLRRGGLQFKSQRLSQEADGPLLVLEAEGELAEVEYFTEAMQATPGVREITELAIDGVNVMENELAEDAEPPEVLESESLEPAEPEVLPAPAPAVAMTPAAPPGDSLAVSDVPESGASPRGSEPVEEHANNAAKKRRRRLRLRTRL